jgi:hypothetical protein
MTTNPRFLGRVFGATLFLVSSALAACGAPTGSERGACFPNGTCNTGLSCISNLCVLDNTGGDAASSDATDAPRSDTGGGSDVTNSDAMDSGPLTDAPTTDDTTSSDAPADSPVTSDGGACTAAGVECAGYAAALATAARNATSVDNCVIQLHQSDCCGAMHAYGINHGSRSDLCTAETACVAMYPTPAGCSDSTITTDTGETTSTMADVKVRAVDGMPCSFDPTQTCYRCETFVCNTGSCRTAPGIMGGCG